ncbi:MAG TPA: hypothetical protein VGE82_02255 [Nitrososphaera sp.]
MPKSSGKASASSSKKIMIYAVIGIVAVAAIYLSLSLRSTPQINMQDTTNNQQVALQRFEQQFCGNNTAPNSNAYISEVSLPSKCEMPLGIAIDGDKVWYVSTKQGLLGVYNSTASNFSEYEIPSWPSRSLPFVGVPSWSMVWAVKPDGKGNIWFTDQNNTIWRFNESNKLFDMFKVPANYPSALDFDSQGNLYLLGINSHSIFYGNVSEMRNGTSDGFTEIKLPTDAFSGTNLELVTAGGLVVDKERNDLWTSLLDFQDSKGQLFQYDINTKKVVRTVNLPPDLGAPVGMELDNSGNLWVADHGTSTFFRYDPITDSITKFVTSIASPKIYGGSTPPTAYTLPYWIEKGGDGTLWFNEHTGNKIARFDPENLTLVEYWIPSQNRAWSLCPEGTSSCGIANAMQFTVNPNNDLWFTEWTENKIGKLNSSMPVPISVSVPNEITVAKGQSAEIKITINASSDFSGQMMDAGTFMPNGALGNSTGIFSEETVAFSAGSSKEVSYTLTPAEDLKMGTYMIMLGAGNDDISVMKAVKVNVI